MRSARLSSVRQRYGIVMLQDGGIVWHCALRGADTQKGASKHNWGQGVLPLPTRRSVLCSDLCQLAASGFGRSLLRGTMAVVVTSAACPMGLHVKIQHHFSCAATRSVQVVVCLKSASAPVPIPIAPPREALLPQTLL
jgi:hypothetical protein